MMRLQLPPWNRWWQTNLPLRAIISGRFFKICLKILESNKAARLEGPGPHWEEKPIYFNFFKIYFWCRPFLKTLLNSLQHCFCFLIFFFFWPWVVWGISSPTKDWTCSPCHWKAKSESYLLNWSCQRSFPNVYSVCITPSWRINWRGIN